MTVSEDNYNSLPLVILGKAKAVRLVIMDELVVQQPEACVGS